MLVSDSIWGLMTFERQRSGAELLVEHVGTQDIQHRGLKLVCLLKVAVFKRPLAHVLLFQLSCRNFAGV